MIRNPGALAQRSVKTVRSANPSRGSDAEAVERAIGHDEVPVGGACRVRRERERAASRHPLAPVWMLAEPVADAGFDVFVASVPVETPFEDVAVHVVEAETRWGVGRRPERRSRSRRRTRARRRGTASGRPSGVRTDRRGSRRLRPGPRGGFPDRPRSTRACPSRRELRVPTELPWVVRARGCREVRLRRSMSRSPPGGRPGTLPARSLGLCPSPRRIHWPWVSSWRATKNGAR